MISRYFVINGIYFLEYRNALREKRMLMKKQIEEVIEDTENLTDNPNGAGQILKRRNENV